MLRLTLKSVMFVEPATKAEGYGLWTRTLKTFHQSQGVKEKGSLVK